MAALTAVQPSAAGTSAAGAAVSGTDTISQSQLGSRGAYLVIANGGSGSDTVAITDGGNTPAGSAGTSTGGAVANGTTKAFYVSPFQVTPSTGLVTVTHSTTTTVTYQLFPIG